jgi:uncharacterized protein YijF (DUF1287 family)
MLSRRILLAGALTAGASYLVLTGKRTASAGTVPAEHWAEKLVKAGQSQIGVTLVYDPAYTALDYPNGDVPRAKGVCTDVIVRAYRDGLGIDPQRLVHEDMKSAFAAYPQKWGVTQMLPGNKTHIVLVSNLLNPQATRPLAIHNIGWGTRIEDVLFAYQVTGHYRFRG